MLGLFDGKVEIAFNAGYNTPAASRVWTDVTDYVEGALPVKVTRGRQDEYSQTQPAKCSLTLDNKDGRFTPSNTGGAYYPNVKKGRPLRVTMTYNGVDYARFTGYVDEWPVEWNGTSSYAAASITAAGRLARMGAATELRSIVEEEVLYDDPVLYFPLSEPEGSTRAGNVAANRQDSLEPVQVGSGGSIAFGAGTGPSTDDLTAPVFTRASAANGLWLRSLIQTSITSSGDHCLQLEVWFVTSTVDAQTAAVLFHDDNNYLLLHVTAAGAMRATVLSQGSEVTIGGATVTDGLLHHAVLTVVLNDGTGLGTPRLILDGAVTAGSTIAFPKTGSVCYFPTYTQLGVGGPAFSAPSGTLGGLLNGTIAHVAAYVQASTALSDSRLEEHRRAGVDGFAGEGSGARIQRYARLAGIPAAEVSVETGLSTSIAHGDTTGQTPLAMMRRVEETESGVLFDGRTGLLTFHARSHRYGVASAFTLDVSAQEVEDGLTPHLDDQGLVNDFTASRPGGVSVRSVNQASVDEYGVYRDQVELLTTSDAEVASAAEWRVGRSGEPRVKVPAVPVEVSALPAAKIPAVLNAEIGTRFTLSGLPSQAPASSLDFFIEGIEEEWTATTYRMSFNTSAAGDSNVWQLDSATYSQLDSSSVLAY